MSDGKQVTFVFGVDKLFPEGIVWFLSSVDVVRFQGSADSFCDTLYLYNYYLKQCIVGKP